ncbi:hypothetical protein K438DRAFT_1879213, partial [Mycena galopus ATCC 62051]
MTLPPHFTTLDLSGRFILNHILSDSYEEMLEQQGVDFELRHAVSTAFCWTPDTLKYGVLQYHVCTDAARSENGRSWSAVETWGIEAADGKRRFADTL